MASRIRLVGGTALLVCLAAVLPGLSWGSYSGTVDVRVSSGSDDAEERISDGDIYRYSSDLEMIDDTPNHGDQIIGIRFQGIGIPKGSTITNAYIAFTADESHSGATSLTIEGQDVDDPSTFSTSDYDISNRTGTSASVGWNDIAAWSTGEEYQTPDLSTIVQEIVNRDNWGSGNAMVFIVSGYGKRVVDSYDGSASMAALLHVEYTSEVLELSVVHGDDDAEEDADGDMDRSSSDLEMVAESTDQIIGIRFQGVPVPQGVIITRSYLIFTSDETDSVDTDLIIQGEAIDDSPAFSSSDNDISDRTRTTQQVEWNDIPAWDAKGVQHDSPDISAVIQEIVGRSGWTSGNDLTLVISGSGKRVAESDNKSGGTPPKLHIAYSEDALPFITVDQTSIGASHYVGGNAAAASFIITNTGSAVMNYTLSEDGAWLSLSSTGGSLAAGASAIVDITYSTSSLTAGTHQATITIIDANAANSPLEIGVSVEILELSASSSCGHVPVYTENLVSPAILILLDVSSSMTSMMNISSDDDKPRTPDLSGIVQEIVNRPSWESGNAMVFIIDGTGHRTADSYDGSSGDAPLLHVEYTYNELPGTLDIQVGQSSDDAEESAGGSLNLTSSDLELVDDGSDQTIGIRFLNVSIEQGATIDNATIAFTIDESQSEATSLIFHGEDLDDPPTFADNAHNISARTTTTASVAWNAATDPALEEWGGATQMSRIDIGKDAISDLVKDRGVSWGYGTWSGKTSSGYTEDINYTKVHVGCKNHTDQHQDDLQASIGATVSHSGTPFKDSLIGAGKYFAGEKADDAGDTYTEEVCQPTFLIDVTDGLGHYGSTVENISTETGNLYDNEISAVAVGFGIDDASQINAMAAVANQRGNADPNDDLYALHNEEGGVGRPFLANNKEELVDALSTITESIKASVFHGSAPAPTTSADLGDTVIVANFDASDWTGDIQAVNKGDTGAFDSVAWTASEQIPFSRSVFTIDSSDHTTVIGYAENTLADDNYLCKDIGDIINSTPVVVGVPPFYYPFDGYEAWKRDILDGDLGVTRDSMVYIGANDGSLHALSLLDGVEQWAFIPEVLQSKLDKADNPTYDMCDGDYCHQYFVDGSPVAGDIFNGTDWKTILVTGLREGGEAYFALDITSSEPFLNGAGDQAGFLWEFTDSELGQTWADVSIDRVVDSSGGAAWGVFFGSGYSTNNQENKVAYLFGIQADDKADLWKDSGGSATNRIVVADDLKTLYYDAKTADYTVGETATGGTSGATGTVLDVSVSDGTTGSLLLNNVSGTFQNDEALTSAGGAATVNGILVNGRIDDALSSILVADLDYAGYMADRIYAGNLYGTMYRAADIGKSEVPSVTKLFEFDPFETSPNINPIRGQAGFAYRHTTGAIRVYFGTGRYEAQTDKTDMNRQYFFGLKDDSGSTATYKYIKTGDVGLKLGTDVQANLESKYVTDVNTGKKVRTIDGTNPNNLSWAVKLDNTSTGMLGSERVIEKPMVVGGIVLFTSFIPDQDICSGNGDTWVYALDYETGLAPTSPVFDLNEDGVVDENDKVEDALGNVYVPAAIQVGSGQGSHPVLHRDTLFVTTTGAGLTALVVHVRGVKAKLRSWKEIY